MIAFLAIVFIAWRFWEDIFDTFYYFSDHPGESIGSIIFYIIFALGCFWLFGAMFGGSGVNHMH